MSKLNIRFFLGPVLAMALTATPHAFADEQSWAPYGIEPSWFLRGELLSFGADVAISPNNQHLATGWLAPNFSFGSCEAEWHRVRLGMTLIRSDFEVDALSVLPISAGYTIWQRPHNYAGRLFSRVPEVYARFTGDWSSLSITDMMMDNSPHEFTSATLELVTAIDGFGGGLSVSAGVAASYDTTKYYRPDPRSSCFFTPFIGIRVRVPTLTAGF